ncbi:MAG: hypothetical protein WD669_12310, partial [Pirellulales bacterium]
IHNPQSTIHNPQSTIHNPMDDDDQEYEVEPPDADVLALEQRRAQEVVEAFETSIDVDEIYRDMARRNDPVSIKLPDTFRFRFQIKHMLIATAVVAIVLTMWRVGMLVNFMGVILLSVLGGALAYVELQEQRRWMEAERRWAEKYERRRQYLERPARPRPHKAEAATIYDDLPFDSPRPVTEAPLPPSFRFQFSLMQLMAAMTLAAVVLGVTHMLGGPAIAAMLLGFIALIGLAVHALGADPPQFVVLGWWLILVLYIMLGLATTIGSVF